MTIASGARNGVAVIERDEGGFLVQTPFCAGISNLLAGAGAVFDRAEAGWRVPQDGVSRLEAVLPEVYRIAGELQEAQLDARTRAAQFASEIAQREGRGVVGAPQFRDFMEKERAIVGPVVAVNPYVAVQLTGFGADDGAPFLRVHNVDNIRSGAELLRLGETVSVIYDQKLRADVTEAQVSNARERLEKSLGETVDGVRVDVEPDKAIVRFEYNEPLQYRLRRGLDTVRFEKASGGYSVALPSAEEQRSEALDELARTVSGMRREFVAQSRERDQIAASLAEWMDKPPVLTAAFTRDGASTSGTVVALTDRFVAQTAGPGNVVLHHRGALVREGSTGEGLALHERVEVSYSGGRGLVMPARDRAEPRSRAPER